MPRYAQRAGVGVENALTASPPRLGAQVVGSDFNIWSPEFALRWSHVHPERLHYDFEEADYLYDAARFLGMRLRGSSLLTAVDLPPWLCRCGATRVGGGDGGTRRT